MRLANKPGFVFNGFKGLEIRVKRSFLEINMKKLIALGSFIGLLLLIVPSCAKPPANPPPANITPVSSSPATSTTLPGTNQTAAQPAIHPGVGDTAPDLTLTDMTGKTVSLADYKGQIVWLNFWATW